MTKSLVERIQDQFRVSMENKGINQTELAVRMGVTQTGISRFLTKPENLTIKTIEKIANAIGGEIEIKFTPSKTEIELLKEEIVRLKKQIEAKRYVENGTLNRK